jgi:hypothetical protein
LSVMNRDVKSKDTSFPLLFSLKLMMAFWWTSTVLTTTTPSTKSVYEIFQIWL